MRLGGSGTKKSRSKRANWAIQLVSMTCCEPLSPRPSQPARIPRLVAVVGYPRLAGLAGTSEASLRRYADGERSGSAAAGAPAISAGRPDAGRHPQHWLGFGGRIASRGDDSRSRCCRDRLAQRRPGRPLLLGKRRSAGWALARRPRGPAQYLSTAPDAASAEFLRHQEIDDLADLAGIERSLWAAGNSMTSRPAKRHFPKPPCAEAGPT